MRKILSNLIKVTLVAIFVKYPGLLASSLRLMVAKQLQGHDRIDRGLFKGLQLSAFTWNSSDRASILAGSYETEVQDWLPANVMPRERDLLNIGSTDGLYAIGLLRAKLASRAFCFEINKTSRLQLSANAALNNVEPNQLKVGGLFYSLDAHESAELSDFSFDNALFIIDAEGGEYEFVDEHFCHKFRHSVGIIELHTTDDGQKTSELASTLERFFDVTFLETGARDPQTFPLLRGIADDYRWAVMSEGRDRPGQWAAPTPKASNGTTKR